MEYRFTIASCCGVLPTTIRNHVELNNFFNGVGSKYSVSFSFPVLFNAK